MSVGVVLVTASGHTASAADVFAWGAPKAVGQGLRYGAPASFTRLSCPSAGLCVGVDDLGDVVSSTDPAGGTSAWIPASVDAGTALIGLSCPSASLCVAVDSLGRVLTSADPGGGATAWQASAVDTTGGGLADVSCPTVSLCVAVDGHGRVLTSTAPAGGVAAWALSDIGAGVLKSVSCPSVSLCVAAGAGTAWVSADPAGGAGAWKAQPLPIPASFSSPYTPPSAAADGVSCPSSGLCVIGAVVTWIPPCVDPYHGECLGGGGEPVPSPVTYLSTDPAQRLWTIASTSYEARQASCRAPSLCVLAGGRDGVLTSTDLTTPNPTFTAADVGLDVLSVACPKSAPCLAAGQADTPGSRTSPDLATAATPEGGAGAWTAARIAGTVDMPSSASCPSASLCAAVDTSGNVLTATDPGGHAAAWSAGHVEPADSLIALNAISCPTPSLCVAADTAGNVLTSTSPSARAASWQLAHIVDEAPGAAGLTGISCPSTALCVAVDAAGKVLSSTDPARGAGAWQVVSDRRFRGAAAISCASPSLCVAVTGSGRAMVSTHPGGRAGAWSSARLLDAYSPLAAVACPSARLCVAVDSYGVAVASARPAAGARTWQSAQPVPLLTSGLSCAGTGLCVAFGDATTGGGALGVSTTYRTGGYLSWSLSHAEASSPRSITALACPSDTVCVALDDHGNALAGRLIGSSGPSRAALRARLRRILAPPGRVSGHAGFYTLSLRVPPVPGDLAIDWYAMPSGLASRRHRHRILVAAGEQTFAGSDLNRQESIVVALTREGRRLIGRQPRRRLLAECTFTPEAGQPIRARRSFTISRR